MSVRPFDWRDLPALYRCRNRSVFLDSALILTRGPMLTPGALLSYLAPSIGVFTAIANGNEENKHPLIGQVSHPLDNNSAHLAYLTPEEALEASQLLELLDYLVAVSGERGALRLLADIDEQSGAFESLRHGGFATYTRQRIWRLGSKTIGGPPSPSWRSIGERDLISVKSLYNNLVPGIVQQIEPFPLHPRGMVCQQEDELLAYVELRVGHQGIWVQPFVHPDVQDVRGLLDELIQSLPAGILPTYTRPRPVYFCVRSYQAWLEPAIEELGTSAGPRQAVMVKHLAIPQKVGRAFALPALESGHAGMSAPVIRMEKK